VCGLARSLDNPLQSAHIIGFDLGVIELGLTPEFLDSDENIVTAHRRTCNKVSELSLNESMMRLRDLGVEDVPLFLSAAVRESWVRLITNEKRE